MKKIQLQILGIKTPGWDIESIQDQAAEPQENMLPVKCY
jgi:hypothetical protein